MKIELRQFGGIAPKINAVNLNDSGAQVAENCRFDGADLSALPGPATVMAALPKPAATRSLYRYRHASDEALYWLHWPIDVDVVPGPIAGDTAQRLYFTRESGKPGWTTLPLATNGGSNYPVATYELGIPVPTATPASTVTTAATDRTPTPERRVYVYTYVSASGEEGAPSPPSNPLSVVTGDIVTVTNLPAPPAGAFVLTHKRVYRSVVDSTGAAEFYFVGEVEIGASSFVDNLEQANEVMASREYLPPPANLQGLTAMQNGILAGFVGKDLYFCEPYLPYAWPDRYRLTTDYEIVGLAAFGQSLLVATTGHPYIVTGIDPAGMSMDPAKGLPGCIAKRSIVSTGDGAIYASASGLQGVGNAGARELTAEEMRSEQWLALNPKSLTAVWHKGRYIGFTPAGGLMLDEAGRLITLTQGATAAWVDPLENVVYLANGRALQRFESGASLTMRWRSKRFEVGQGYSPAVARVESKAWPVTFTLLIDQVARHTQTVTSREPFRLPSGLVGNELEMEVSGAVSGVTSMAVAQSPSEFRRV